MPSKTIRRGRPPLGAKVRTRISVTLSPQAIEALRDLTRQKGASVSRTVEGLILSQSASQNALAKTGVTLKQLTAIFKKRGIERAWLFGSVLRPDFSAESDVDLLVNFKKDPRRGYFEFVEVKNELEDFFGRPVDLIEERLLENPFRRDEILAHRQEIYAA